MAKSWSELTLDEAVERAKGISRQALHIAIKTYTANGRTDIVEQLRLVRKTLKRDKRIAKVGKEAIEAKEASTAAYEARVAKMKQIKAQLASGASMAQVAKDNNASYTVVYNIAKGKTWSRLQ
jgi:siderophore synthetase component